MSKLSDEFAAQGRKRAGVLFLQPKVALALVRAARERGVRVLGIDGFKLTETTVQPVMEESIDLSADPRDWDRSWALAEDFLARRMSTGLYFEVVIEDK